MPQALLGNMRHACTISVLAFPQVNLPIKTEIGEALPSLKLLQYRSVVKQVNPLGGQAVDRIISYENISKIGSQMTTGAFIHQSLQRADKVK